MDEWIIGNRIPHIDKGTYQVQMIDDSLRTCTRKPGWDYSALFFTDCTHPAQNVICDESRIKAWRLDKLKDKG